MPAELRVGCCTACTAGQYGASTVRRTAVDTGAVQLKTPMSNNYFGEGLARFGDKLYQITWLTNEGFVYSIPDLKQVGGAAGQLPAQWLASASNRVVQPAPAARAMRHVQLGSLAACAAGDQHKQAQGPGPLSTKQQP